MADHESLRQAVIRGDADQAEALVRAALGAGGNPAEILDSALIPAMDVVGERFAKLEYFLPEMLVAARAMQTALTVLRPHLVAGGARARGKVVLGTVQGDLHDIGKSLLGMLLEGGGFDVVDLGTDVSPEAFVDAVRRERPGFLMMSALLTTTMGTMRRTVAALEAEGLRRGVRVAVGGAPLNQRFADEIGADFYAQDAASAVARARDLAGVREGAA